MLVIRKYSNIVGIMAKVQYGSLLERVCQMDMEDLMAEREDGERLTDKYIYEHCSEDVSLETGKFIIEYQHIMSYHIVLQIIISGEKIITTAKL